MTCLILFRIIFLPFGGGVDASIFQSSFGNLAT